MRPFAYERAAELAAALATGTVSPAALQQLRPDAQYLAGGTTLLDLMKIDVMRPDRVLDIRPGPAAQPVIRAEGGLWLSAVASMAQAAEHPALRRDYPVVAESLQQAASAQLRNMATLGGNVLQRTRCPYFRDTAFPCNKREPGSGCAAIGGVTRLLAVLGVSEHCIASYPGDFAQALIALDAEVETLAPDGSRRFPFADLHRPPGGTPHVETTLQPGELITGFRLPSLPWARRSLYLKVRDRESYAFALASAAVALDLRDGVVHAARIGLGGVAAVPWRAHEAESVLQGQKLTETRAVQAAEAAFAGAVTQEDNAFKPELGRRTLVRALLQAAAMEI
ncbi:xanthine dehydrogenase family protein subunit M [Roseomonas sp. M0104]|uniref:Xanthine dehydrogenase family protein subunit M n=1 Tax=Teichococcus coralli TaxID=2545983 RepID=A0A845BAG7_9PROT|nr:FAD binding domain-containing protein [Pseudoroseomonas coralli]MXP63086.1 xanthine dehydrogenase family protein subunit M [Pseudoroseomonas coralli]